MRRVLGRDVVPVLVLTALAALAYSAFALARHNAWLSGYDLGIFSQSIWHYAHFEAPISTVKDGINLLGDHFHPIVALLAPLSWIGLEAEGLLVAQGILVAASIVPVYVFARERLDKTPAYAVAVAYACFWGLWSGVGFDFHEVAFAPLLVALGILWGHRRQWGRFALAMAGLLLVKEDMTLLVAFFGLWLLTRREWRAGAITAVAGLVAYVLVIEVLIPHFGGADFGYWSYDAIGTDLADAVRNILTEPWLPFEVALNDREKVRTIGLMLIPFLALPLGSRIFILAIPLIAERMLSTNPNYWSSLAHYTLPLAPVLAMAAAAGLANLRDRLPERSRRVPVLGVAVAFVVLGIALNETGSETINKLRDTRPAPAFDEAAGRAVDAVPDDASVASQDFVYPRLAARETAELIRTKMVDVDYVVVSPFVLVGRATGNQSFRELGENLRALLPRMTPVWFDGGWLVLRRGRHRRAFPPFEPAGRRAVARATREWTRAGVTLGSTLVRCGPDRECVQAAEDSFAAANARLHRALGRAARQAQGACGELALQARIAASELAHAAMSRDPAALVRATERRDAAGRVLVVTELCAPSKPSVRDGRA